MVKTSRVRRREFISTLKALFPILAGAMFFGLILYVISVYQYQANLNTYFVLNDNREGLQETYYTELNLLRDQLGSLRDKDSNAKVETLNSSSTLNNKIIELVNQMLDDGYKIMDLGVSESANFDIASNELNFLRIQLHTQIDKYIDRQIFAINYIKLKDSTESCYNRVALTGTNYSKIVTSLSNCAKKLSSQVEFLDSAPEGIDGFTKTTLYLDSYENYWSLVKEMYTLLMRDRGDQAKGVANDVKSQLKVTQKQKSPAETELNTILLKDVEGEIDSVTKMIEEKRNEVESLESSDF